MRAARLDDGQRAELLRDSDAVLKALRRGFLAAIRNHQVSGVPMVYWEDGSVIELAADEVLARLQHEPWYQELAQETAPPHIPRQSS
ncbi:MAG: hypothetical protein IT204_23750 [Fimbriimonadaceae bacterium]|nr:hypothetical protein [Fimbriimonadaceae bacterium]